MLRIPRRRRHAGHNKSELTVSTAGSRHGAPSTGRRAARVPMVQPVCLEDSLLASRKTTHPLNIGSSSRSCWYLPKGTENLCPRRNLHADVYSSCAHHGQQSEATKVHCGPSGQWTGLLLLSAETICTSTRRSCAPGSLLNCWVLMRIIKHSS